MALEKINPETLPDAGAMGYSQITTCDPGKLIYLSGQVAWSRDGTPVPADIGAQAKIAFGNVQKALEAVNASAENITSMRLYIVDLDEENMGAVGPALAGFFGGQAPCVTAIGVTSLADPALKIEIEVTAVL